MTGSRSRGAVDVDGSACRRIPRGGVRLGGGAAGRDDDPVRDGGGAARTCRNRCGWRGGGRTDAGGARQGAGRRFRRFGETGHGDDRGGNALLPGDIRILSAEEVPEGFDARRAARSKRVPVLPAALARGLPVPLAVRDGIPESPVDVDAVRRPRAAGRGSTTSRPSAGRRCTARTTVRTIFRAGVTRHDAPGLYSSMSSGAVSCGTWCATSSGPRSARGRRSILRNGWRNPGGPRPGRGRDHRPGRRPVSWRVGY